MKLNFAFILIFMSTLSNAQNSDKLSIFIDCQYCGQEFIKQNLTYVNYVRDTKEADVHLLFRTQSTASGGTENTIEFIGKDKFKQQSDTVIFMFDPNLTQDEQRRIRLKYIKAGLIPFLLKNNQLNDVEITSTLVEQEDNSEVKDKWNYWVYNISANGWFNGQSTYNSFNSWSEISADRVTEKWRIGISAGMQYNESNYIFSDGTSTKAIQRSQFGDVNLVKSISQHWSAGLFGDVNSSIFSNLKLSHNLNAGIEYNVFKYENSSENQLRFVYEIGPRCNRYNETTIYHKNEEWLGEQSFSVAFMTQKKWGSISSSVSWNNYLHDFNLYNLRFWQNFRIRILKGLNINLGGSFNVIKNQITLPGSGSSDFDLILQQKQQETNFSYWGNAGISYTFGSIYNNIVNPRFGF